MMNKVFGIGWAKTGTTTLGKCFEILGYNHQPQRLDLAANLTTGDLSEIMKIAERKDTFEDWPWLLLFKEFDQAFPGSRFVLTQRTPERWIKSYLNMLQNQGEASEELNEVRKILYGLPFPEVTETQLVARYQQHNCDVMDYFRERPNDLLVVDWEKEDGWDRLCGFLNHEVPDMPFPHANRGKYKNNSLLTKIKKTIATLKR
jgi:hypothetical protein